ncbi:uncharacterized protein IL334_003467 [Kwoniella shivajii]|uniref:F-box/LRR-repeat protein 15-like leucin rich repeat domain-containing protein n=1 Tax=Kwoniella shivajii TaxID=564305 RepID=A0ABZ1CY75_9TREE|nr:hypothetical protein IL334_003467 [Kwoniella shivajii]
MSRQRRAAGAVRGPSSALTSFLANLGVEPSTRLTTWGDTSALTPVSNDDNPHVAHDGLVIEGQQDSDPAGAVTARNVVAGPSQVGDGTTDLEAETKKRKRRGGTDSGSDYSEPIPKKTREASIDSDDIDADHTRPSGPIKPKASTSTTTASIIAPGPLKPVGDFMECGQCAKRFTVVHPFAKVKKAPVKKTVAGKKESRAKIIHYEQKKGVLALGDLCIQIYRGPGSTRRYRRYQYGTPETAQLFYSSTRDELSMYDCTRLTPEAFITMAKLCPKLISLHLHLCGQLSADALTTWGKSLKQLKRLELFAPFLVRKDGWINLFKSVGKRFERLLVTQSPRIDVEIIQILTKSCPNLTELRLAEIGLFNTDCLIPLKSLKKLKYLDLTAPGTPLTDDSIIDLLSAIGATLETLDLSDNPDLTDAILPAISAHCPKLQRLSLRNMVELTDEGVASFFLSLKERGRPGLEWVDLEKGHELQDNSLQALVSHSGSTIEKLSMLGWREVSAEALSDLIQCKNLKELDLGWCRQVTDFTVKDILEGCDKIELVRVWGCNQLTDAIPRKKGVKVIGVESHSI